MDKRNNRTPLSYKCKADRQKIFRENPEEKIKKSRKKKGAKTDFILVDVETNRNLLQITAEENNSGWEDTISTTEIVEYSSPEILRAEGNNFSEKTILVTENSRKDTYIEESDFHFCPTLASTPVKSRFVNSKTFDLSVHQTANLESCLENEVSHPIIDTPDVFDFGTTPEELTSSSEILSPMTYPIDFETETVESDKSTKTRDITPFIGGKDVIPKKIVFHSKSSSNDISPAKDRQSSRKNEETLKERILPFSPVTETELPSCHSNSFNNKKSCEQSAVATRCKARKQTPRVKTTKKNTGSYVIQRKMTKKEVEKYEQMLKTIDFCPLRLIKKHRRLLSI